MKRYDFPQNSFGDKFYELYFESLENIKKNTDYKNNLEKIELYKRILKNKHLVNQDFLELLISAVEEKVETEYEYAIKNLIDYIDNK